MNEARRRRSVLHDPCSRCGRTLLELRKDASRESMRGSAPLCGVPGCPLVKRVMGFGAKPDDEATTEEVARKRSAAPTTVPNDAEVITALTEGERRIAEKNPRAAEASSTRSEREGGAT